MDYISLINANTIKINEAAGLGQRGNKHLGKYEFNLLMYHATFFLSPDSTSFNMAEILFLYECT